MQYNRLGHSGLRVSRFSIGSWVTYGRQVDDSAAKACIHTALDHGVNFIDNAEAYAAGEAERVVGRVISGIPRHSLVLSSKVFWGGDGPNERGLSRKHVVEACHGALERLQTDYLDLYYCHRPDPDTPVYETALAMDILIRQGKVLYWGTSEWTAAQLHEAYAVCEQHSLVPPQVEQPQYNLFHRARVEDELAPLYSSKGLGTTIWSPLASGILTGKYNDGIPNGSRMSLDSMAWLHEHVTPTRIDQVRRFSAIAADLGCTPAQLALAWAARDASVVSTVITGASRAAQVTENMAAEDVIEKLTPDVLAAIDAIFPPGTSS